MCVDTWMLKNGNLWAIKSFERRSSVLGLERGMKLRRILKALLSAGTSAERDTNKGVCIFFVHSRSGSMPRTWQACYRGGSLPRFALSSCAPLIVDRMRESWLTAHVSIGTICAGWHTMGMPLPVLEINALLTEPFLRAGKQEAPWISCCSPLESWWETRAGPVTHRSLAQDTRNLVWLVQKANWLGLR